MTQSVERWQALGVHPPLDALRRRKLEATQALLGDTITLGDDMWHEPSLLPGWSRAHVAAHLSQNADDLRGLVRAVARAAREDDPTPTVLPADEADWTPSTPAQRRAAVEQGARRTGLELQIGLDTSAGLLSAAFDDIETTGTELPVTLGTRLTVPAPIVALARLSEVALHHVDLGVGHRLDRLDDDTAHWLAAWELFRGQGDSRLPTMLVHTDSGLTAMVGLPEHPPVAEVRGADADLVRWLSGRGDAAGLWASAPVPGILPPH